MANCLFSNQVFVNQENSPESSAPQITFRNLLSPKHLLSSSNNNNNNNNEPNTKIIQSLIICTYICDWNWFAAELALCPFITPQTQIFVIINWVPETCNTEDPIQHNSGTFSEGVRQISIGGAPGSSIERKITIIHPALVGGLMHVKLNLIQFCDADVDETNQSQNDVLLFTRVAIGSANLTADDWCNLRQAFFIAEGIFLLKHSNNGDEDSSSTATSATSLNFGGEIEKVLLWLSLPKEVLQNRLRLSSHSWPTVPDKTKLIFSVPSPLQLSLDKVFQARQIRETAENGKEEKYQKDDYDEEENELLPPIEIVSSSVLRRRQTRGIQNAHDGREDFYNSFLPIAFDLNGNSNRNNNKWYRPPLEVLRSCVESVTTRQQENPSSIVYQASSVGGITDVLLTHFTAAVSPNSGPYPPPASLSQQQQQQQRQEEEHDDDDSREENNDNFAPPPKIITPFPVAGDINRFAGTQGATGPITLRYFQLASTQMYKTGWVPLNMRDGVTCHSKLIFPIIDSHNDDDEFGGKQMKKKTPWLVIGSHNFTADCWAFAKQMLPRNFELSVFVPLSDSSSTVFDLFPHQTDFLSFGENNDASSPRFFFLNHKRDFFAALQHADERFKRERLEHILNSYLMSIVEKNEKEEFYRSIFEKALVYHYSKFEKEVHDDFGRH